MAKRFFVSWMLVILTSVPASAADKPNIVLVFMGPSSRSRRDDGSYSEVRYEASPSQRSKVKGHRTNAVALL